MRKITQRLIVIATLLFLFQSLVQPVLADGEIKPEGEDDQTYFQIIRKAGPNIILQYARLGIDVVKAAEFAMIHCDKGETNVEQLKSANIGD